MEKASKNFIDMTGWVMKEHGIPDSKLTVIKREGIAKNKSVMWLCQCECGNIKIIRGTRIRNGETKSCGCLKKNNTNAKGHKGPIKIIPPGTKFGKLTVLQLLNERDKNGQTIYQCQCDCGNIINVIRSSLINNLTQSCGCIKSKGEQKIQELLQKNNIEFNKQKFFNNCKFEDTNYLAYFDFYVDNKYIIEYDGIQHFQIMGWNTNENLIKIQEHDKFKNQYCFNNNIPIIRIPYWHIDNLCLKDLLLETSSFILKKKE